MNIMNKNYISKIDYERFAGEDWPSYENLINNNYIVTPELKIEIDDFLNLAHENYITQKKQDQDTKELQHFFKTNYVHVGNKNFSIFQKNKKLFVTKQDYENAAGNDWPSYPEFLDGNYGTSQKTVDEITKLIDISLQQGIKFPIRTATSCQSKWTWSTIFLNMMSTSSCHKVNPIKFSLEEFDNFHNLPKKLDDRRLMLKGEWPTGGCEYCRDIEAAHGHSDRMHNLEIRGLTPPELENNLEEVNVSPRIVEIFAQNKCNFKCVYCTPYFSSRIADENKKFGAFDKDGVSIPILEIPDNTKEYFSKFLNWLEKNVKDLVRLHLLGGETFIQHELMTKVLDIIEKNPNENLELNIFTHLNAPDKFWDSYIERIQDLQKTKNIRYLDLTASIDCWGKAAEYVRHGLDLQKFEERLAWASEQGNWLRFNINQTITSMTIKTMPELIQKIDYYSQNKHIGHYFEFYINGGPMFQHPKMFAYEFWKDDFERIFASMPTRTVHQQEAIVRMRGHQNQLEHVKTYNFPEIKKLQVYLDELDRRRNTNWREIFSYLDIHE